MDSDDETMHIMLEDERDFDDDLREHLAIIACLQKMLDDDTEKKKSPQRGGSKPGRKKSKPRQRLEGHIMLFNDYFAENASQADNSRLRYGTKCRERIP